MRGVRSWIAVAAHLRKGAGKHGPGKKAKHKQDRKQAKEDLKREASE